MHPHVTPSIVRMGLILPLLVVFFSRLTLCQQLPTRDEEVFMLQMANPESVADTKVLPDGAETKGYVFKDSRKL
jgi:hypothetical protein